MRMTLDLPESLVRQAMKLSRRRTKAAAVIAALEEFVRKRKVRGLKNFAGKVDLDVDLAASRCRR